MIYDTCNAALVNINHTPAHRYKSCISPTGPQYKSCNCHTDQKVQITQCHTTHPKGEQDTNFKRPRYLRHFPYCLMLFQMF